ncbi:MAG: hypothetical protein NC253_01920 [Ruminococcus sp.]|nr:hypothetical protein [Ruminococcus sp.]MCM1382540.1 hypothetical protein [Muribaculaceae bacterium]MCM1478052.1 hypothetical protein [Muribaculaceae bacterium]
MQVNNILNGGVNGAYGVKSAENAENRRENVPEEEKYSHGRDEYVPGEEDTPIGLYSVSEDGDGGMSVEYDMAEKSPEKAADGEKSQKSESCTCNTDRVDREIEKLREKQEQLEEELRSTEGEKAEQLKKQLESVSAELALKDNDTYRRQNAVFS